MESGVTSCELVEMAALEAIDPPIEDRIDAGFAQVMALIYNRTRGKGEKGKPAAAFLPKWGPPDDDEMERKLRTGIGILREVRKHG